MPVIRELVAKLGFDVDNQAINSFDAAVDAAKVSMAGLEKRVDATGKKLKRLGFGLTAFVTAPLGILSGVMIKAASDAEETAQRFDVVFRDIADDAQKMASDFGRDFGIARDKSKELLGTTGDLLTGFAFTQEQALDLANQVARLGGDLASFNNIAGGTEEAVLRLTKGILGETENLKLLGIVVNQGTKEFKALTKQIQENRGLTLQQAKAQAILTLAIRQSQNAIGDFERTSKGFANQLRIFRSLVRNVVVEFGKFLLPVANKILGVFIKIFETIDKLPRILKAVILAIGGFIAIVGPLLILLGSLVLSFGFFIIKILFLRKILALFGLTTIGILVKVLKLIFAFFTRFTLAGVALRLVAGAFVAIGFAALKIIAIFALISFAIFLVIDDFKTWLADGDSVIGALIGRFKNLKDFITNIARTIKNVFTTFWQALISGSEADWNKFIDALITAFFTLGGALGTIMIKIETALGKLMVGIVKLIIGSIVLIIQGLGKAISLAISRIGGLGGALLNRIFGKGTSDKIKGLGADPLGQGSAAARLSAAGGGGSSQTNINTTVNMEVPPGTSEQQVQIVEETAKRSFDQMFNNKITDSLMATAQAEQ